MSRSILSSPIRKVDGETASACQDLLAIEEPLEIRLGNRPLSITMRTPGHDFELAAGFLFTEGILEGPHQIQAIARTPNENPRQEENSVTVTLHPGVEVDLERLERHFYTSSSCGICGKASIEALRVQGCSRLPPGSAILNARIIHDLPAALRRDQPVFSHTGGLHAAGLFDLQGNLLLAREDVGRHNAVDKLIGAELLAGRVPLHERMLLVSGRAGFELAQKAVMAGIPILAAVGAPSSLAVETAQRFDMTLIGFVRDGRYNIYSGASRIQ